MTRSAAKRANRNARVIANSVWLTTEITFDAATAQSEAHRYVQRNNVTAWNLDEVNWPYAAELMNRAAKVFYETV